MPRQRVLKQPPKSLAQTRREYRVRRRILKAAAAELLSLTPKVIRVKNFEATTPEPVTNTKLFCPEVIHLQNQRNNLSAAAAKIEIPSLESREEDPVALRSKSTSEKTFVFSTNSLIGSFIETKLQRLQALLDQEREVHEVRIKNEMEIHEFNKLKLNLEINKLRKKI